ncbi:hypothetical protein OROGR_012904 [Orobanche gracilis]
MLDACVNEETSKFGVDRILKKPDGSVAMTFDDQ